MSCNFWNTCPRKLQYYPEAPCHLGKSSVNSRREDCDWYIDSEQDFYCFWKWIRRVSDREGFMEPLLQGEISEMLGLSNSKINQHFKEAMEKLKSFDDFEELKDLF